MVKNISSTLNAKKDSNGRGSTESTADQAANVCQQRCHCYRTDRDPVHVCKMYKENDHQRGLATAFELAAFRLSMIALVKKSVNHSRTVANMPRTGWEQQQQEVRVRSDSVKWLRFCPRWSLLSLLQPSFVLGNVELTFSFLLVLRLSLQMPKSPIRLVWSHFWQALKSTV